MPKNVSVKKVKKKYVPKPIRKDTISYVINGFLPVTAANGVIASFQGKNHEALIAFATGKATKTDLTTLTHTFITSQSLVDNGLGAEYEYALEEAREAMSSIAKRFATWHKMEATKAEMDSLNYGMTLCDQQLEVCTIAELEDAIRLAQIAIKCNHPRKKAKVAA